LAAVANKRNHTRAEERNFMMMISSRERKDNYFGRCCLCFPKMSKPQEDKFMELRRRKKMNGISTSKNLLHKDMRATNAKMQPSKR